MAKLVVSNIEMTYDGVPRYKGEVFELKGSPNDSKMIDVGNLTVFEGDEESLVVDDSGRRFTGENFRKSYRIKDPSAARIDVSPASMEQKEKRSPGRPKGSKDSKPRQRTIDRAVGQNTADAQ